MAFLDQPGAADADTTAAAIVLRSQRPRSLTSSLKSLRRGSTSFRCMRSGRPATAPAARTPRREMLIMALLYQSRFVLHTMEYGLANGRILGSLPRRRLPRSRLLAGVAFPKGGLSGIRRLDPLWVGRGAG